MNPALRRILLDPSRQTPLLVYAEEDLVRNAQGLFQGIRETFFGALSVHFALKSCYRLPVLRSLHALGAGVEVMSLNEYRLARAIGFSGPEILVNGLGRPEVLLEEACSDANRIILDCLEDLRHLHGRPRVGLRLKVDLSDYPHKPYARESKLGLRWDSPELRAVLDRCADLELDLLHVHLASEETDAGLFVHALERLCEYRGHLERQGVSIRSLDLGGGIGSLEEAEARALFSTIGAAFTRCFPEGELLLEPGRYLVNSAGYVAATVTAVKRDGERAYVATDAGTNTLMPHREASYRLCHPPSTPGQDGSPVALVDGITSLSSTVIPELRLDRLPSPGDRIILGHCGAYTTAMSQFWAFDPIPVAFFTREGELVNDLSRDQIEGARRLLLGV
ncbi:MAG: hypothetical protein HY319_19285 [Armatimonadetes bacterium]|nr:hypothetical protein [Armatimonadota bacterium]